MVSFRVSFVLFFALATMDLFNPASARSEMTAVQTSFPGVSCALVDAHPTASLLAAVQRLTDAVKPAAECKNDTDLVKAHDDVKSVMESVKVLNQFWENPDAIAKGNNLGVFHTQLESAIRGIDRVGQNLSNNSFLNGKCGKSSMGAGDVFVAFTDLVSSFAPFALIGASMNPQLSVALPYVLGITAVGSAAKIVSKMLQERGIDASRPEVRTAILTNICEYTKISEKVRFLKLAQSGQLETVTKEIHQIGTHRLQTLFNAQMPEVQTIIMSKLKFESELVDVKSSLRADQAEFYAFKLQIHELNSKPLLCEMTKQLVKSTDPNKFPMRPITNFKRLLSMQKDPSVSQLALVSSEESLRVQFTTTGSNPEQCAQTGLSYVEALARIVKEVTELYDLTMQERTQALSRSNPSFAMYVAKESKTKRELETASKITQILQKLNKDNGVIDKVEMHSQMLNLKSALFNKPTDLLNRTAQWLTWAGVTASNSPAMEYLNFIESQQARMILQFDREMDSLISDLMNYKPLVDHFHRNPDGSLKLNKFGYPMQKSYIEAQQEQIAEMRRRESLQPISLGLVPVGSLAHKKMCHRLENIWLAWASVMDHLTAQSFFCLQINSLFDSETDSDMVERCDGKQDLSGRQVTPSGIQQAQSRLARRGYKTKALLVSEKLKELLCPMPNGIDVMQGL